MATFDKPAIITIDPDVQPATDRASRGAAIPIGVRRPCRAPSWVSMD